MTATSAMWLKSSVTPLVIKLNRSMSLAGLILLGHAGGLVCLWLAPLPGWGQALITVPVVFGGVRYLKRYALLSAARAVVGLEWRADGWLLTDNRGRQQSARLAANSMRSRVLTLLLFLTDDGPSISVPICRDMLAPDDYRRLQLCLTVRNDAGQEA